MVEAASQQINAGASQRDLDPNVLQRRASDPESSVWVSASAGTGKTKVLTDRVLRLLLPREDGRVGTAAHKILCLTFTKAAASEMALRISKTLARWAVFSQEELGDALKKLLGRDAKEHEIRAARRLFADVVDVPGGLKIMTIHSFCQSVLGRFPLEAQISPNFTVLEERDALDLLLQAQGIVLQGAQRDDATPLAESLNAIAHVINEKQFLDLLHNITGERHQFSDVLKRHFGVDGLYTKICELSDVPAGVSAEELLCNGCSDDVFDVQVLRKIAAAMIEQGTKSDVAAGEKIAAWLAMDVDERSDVATFHEYGSAFLTQKGTVRTKLCGKKVSDALPDAQDILAQEAQRVLKVMQDMRALNMAALMRDLFRLCEAVIAEYEELKVQHGALDFDDLIFKTLGLLRGHLDDGQPNNLWVQYKLDQGLNHILIDEAQDTNPEQWEIIDALCSDFFSGAADFEEERTVFTVGDEKQSIYSFQRASPEEFSRMQADFAGKVQEAKKRWSRVDLNISFRSTRTVLRAVDAVFASEELRKGLGDQPIEHHAFRRGQAGLVELWPLFEADEVEGSSSLWSPPVEVQDAQSGAKKLAQYTAQKIREWLDSEDELPSHGRRVQPGDIMILVRTRNAFVSHLSRALKTLGVPVGGADRIVIHDQLAVQDILAAARFALLPEDDLTLACLLKSPFIGLSEDALFDLAAGRAGDLWSACLENAAPDVAEYLKVLIEKARAYGPYDFIGWLLQNPCPADEVSGRRAIVRRLGADALDPLDELLGLALDFEHRHIPSLQHFVYAQGEAGAQVKREQEEGGGCVRIMTVHGSKGLQAPIVILPDTVSMPGGAAAQADKRLLWPNQTGFDAPLWSARKDMETGLYSDASGVIDERMDEEYRRLLYVAMTRAEDRLYVAGYRGARDPAEGCWYNLVKRGLSQIEDVEELDDGALRVFDPQIHEPDRDTETLKSDLKSSPLPDWAFEKAPDEGSASQDVMRPSRLEEVAASPISGQNEYRFLRGNLTHKLLQILPDIDAQNWRAAAESYLARYGSELSAQVHQDIVSETLTILEDEEFAPLFGPGSQAEVPVTAWLEGQGLVSGQIDRLIVQENDLYIIDYKTNRPPPQDPNDIPDIYRKQMRAYADAMAKIYPDKVLHAALLWTDGPYLMKVEL